MRFVIFLLVVVNLYFSGSKAIHVEDQITWNLLYSSLNGDNWIVNVPLVDPCGFSNPPISVTCNTDGRITQLYFFFFFFLFFFFLFL